MLSFRYENINLVTYLGYFDSLILVVIKCVHEYLLQVRERRVGDNLQTKLWMNKIKQI